MDLFVRNNLKEKKKLLPGEPKKRGVKWKVGKIKKSEKKQVVPPGLRGWFMVHFYVDLMVGVPLFLFPERILNFWGWGQVDLITTRLFAAALLGIGMGSLLVKKSGVEVYESLLNLKIIWSTAAILGIMISILQGQRNGILLSGMALIVFIFFNFLWIYWRMVVSGYYSRE